MTPTQVLALKIGDPIDGGKFAGIITLPNGKTVAVALLPNKPDKILNWADAMAWATESGGQIPSRPIAALIFANLKSEFEEEWHWMNETCDFDASYAWYCIFYDGYQYYRDKSYEGCARSVRLIHLEP